MTKCAGCVKRNAVAFWSQAVVIALWMLTFERLEYASLDYLFCGAAGLFCLRKNHSAVSRKTAVFALIFSLSTILSNYARFVPLRSLYSIARIGITALGGFLVCGHILSWVMDRQALLAGESEKRPVRVFLLSMTGILAVYWVYLFSSAYPGFFDQDTKTAFVDIQRGAYGFRIPVYYTLFIEGCLRIGYLLGKTGNDALVVYTIVQTTAAAACFAYMLVTLYERNVPSKWLLILGAIYAFLPCYLGTAVSIWKDTPFSIAAAFMCIALYRIVMKVGNTVGDYCVYAISAVAFCLSRTNGWYSFLAISLIALAFASLRNWKLLGISAVVLLSTWILLNPVLDWIGSRGTDYLEILSTPLQQIARVVWSDYDLQPEDVALLDEVLDLEMVADKYLPGLVDPIKRECFRHENMAFFQEHFGEYAALWLRWAVRYPADFLKAWVDLTKGYWSIGWLYWNYHCPLSGDEFAPLGFELVQFDNPLSQRFHFLFEKLEWSSLLRPFFSIGLQFWVVLGCMLIHWKNGRKNWAVGIPALVILVGLWLCTPSVGLYRYAYVTAFIAPFVVCDAAAGSQSSCVEKANSKESGQMCFVAGVQPDATR